MALTDQQYNEIMRVLTDRKNAALREQSARQEAVYEILPAIRVYTEKIADLSSREVLSRIKKEAESAERLRTERTALINKKKKLLEDAGYSGDYLEIHYHCDRCRDTGYADGEKCGCLKQLESEILNRESGLPALMERENFSTLDPEIYDKYRDIEELAPKKITQYEYMNANVIGRVKKYVREFEDPGSHNILMFGPAGTGKTFLSNCIARALIEKQHTVVYERAGDMFGRMSRSAFSRTDDPEAAGLDKRAESCDLLIIDDLGTEFATEYTKARLFSIISNRLSHGLSTIISTNLSMNQICSVYGERVSSRFIGEYMLLPFYGADLRVMRRKGV